VATITEALALALDHHLGGRLEAAETLYGRILDADPAQPDARHLLGVLAGQTGRAALGVDLIGQAMALRPDAADYPSNLGALFDATDEPQRAAAAYRRALALRPDFATAWARLGATRRRLDDGDGAILALTRASSLDPSDGASAGRAALLLRQRALGEREAGRLAAARSLLRRALVLDPQSADLRFEAAQLAYAVGDRGAAADEFRRTLALAPDRADAWANAAALLDERGAAAAALDACRRALIGDPTVASAWINQSAVCLGMGRHAAAAVAARRALALEPACGPALSNLASGLRSLGAVTAGLPLLRRGARLGNYDSERGLLSAILYDPTLDEEARFAEALAFARRRAPSVAPASFRNDPSPDRRLRIGYLSSDFRDHPIARNMASILANHDHAAFEIALYSGDSRSDAMTERLRGWADRWRPVDGLSEAAIAERIRGDGVDLLVTLGGRFDANRPLVAAHRPAPVLVSAHDGGTSGLAGVDALLTDRILAPRGGPERFTERPFRLPGFYSFPVPLDAPPPHPAAAVEAAGRPLVFGSLNNPAKVNDAVLALWARVLIAVPGARLLLRYKGQFLEPTLQRHIVGVLAGRGVGGDRLLFPDGATDRRHHLAIYHDIDVALDTFPFSGATTSFEALWMGVPVVTLPGTNMMGRVSAAHLNAAGAPELIARDADEFVAIAAGLAAAPDRRALCHATLRQRLAASPTLNGPLRARQIERAYRALWRRWAAARG
jgi:protein O-GlcNAc transferase